MTPYSEDLRQRVVETIHRGEGSVRQIASRILVSVSFVMWLLQLPLGGLGLILLMLEPPGPGA